MFAAAVAVAVLAVIIIIYILSMIDDRMAACTVEYRNEKSCPLLFDVCIVRFCERVYELVTKPTSTRGRGAALLRFGAKLITLAAAISPPPAAAPASICLNEQPHEDGGRNQQHRTREAAAGFTSIIGRVVAWTNRQGSHPSRRRLSAFCNRCC